MREIWRGGLALAQNDFGSCVALAGADNFVQKIKNRAIYCEALTWRGFDFELFNGSFRAVFSQNRLFFKANSVLNFSFMHPALQKKYAQFNTTLHVKFGKFLQISSAKFAIYLAIFKFIFARLTSGNFIFTLKICFASLIKFALLSLTIKTIKACNKCARKPIFTPLQAIWLLDLKINLFLNLRLKLIANLQLLDFISEINLPLNQRRNLSKNLILIFQTDLNENLHLNLEPNLSMILCHLRPNLHYFFNINSPLQRRNLSKNLLLSSHTNLHIYLNLRQNLLINSHLSRKDYFNYWHLRTILSKNSHRNLFAILFLLRQKLSLNLLLNRHSCAILHQINLQPNMSLNRCDLSSLLNLCAILRTNLLLKLLINLPEISSSLRQILPPKSALYQNLILCKSFCCDLHLSLPEKSRANSRWVERISCEKVA